MNQFARLEPAAARGLTGFRPRLPLDREQGALLVDLADDLFSPRWWRGLATLASLCIAALALAPGLEPLPGGRPAPLTPATWEQMAATGISPAANGSRTGLPMAETGAVTTLTDAPERTRIEVYAMLGPGERLASALERSGATAGDSASAAHLIEAAAGRPLAAGTALRLLLGASSGTVRSIELLSLRAGLDAQLAVVRDKDRLVLRRSAIAVDASPVRISGRAGDGLYWSLRAAGVSAQLAADYLKALATQVDVGAIGPDDRFDLVYANRRAATGESEAGALVYAGLRPALGPPLQLLRWREGGSEQWLEASGVGERRSGMAWPVDAPITSNFGMRFHPLLHYSRMHKGIDFGARSGTPIVAAADGQVERAGWAGGYGNQVRLAHGGNIETSYSHMSRMVVAPGMAVRQGQLIGYVGTTGLSTGPHLHYEVYEGGTAIDPLRIRFVSRSRLEGSSLAAFKARLAQLLALPTAP
ncbi:M23 family metallopeptidase [Sphingomonas ginkgonis]|uniref:M23 family metallopeptidase n=1 Tax=Sphingomonas ginkgonis TaxID=2315330 RepID=A0A3S0EKG9_9SPHN|nr:M23 family metallopeptidase [Sphingomonas ginkgonis]RST29708.1 M23 family metallopeptidase [Sphingomonas ginkgonis]